MPILISSKNVPKCYN